MRQGLLPAGFRVAGIWLLWALAVSGAVAEGDDARLLAQLQESRLQQGSPGLQRRADLDVVAAERAERIAALPHAERLRVAEPIEVELHRAGVTGHSRSTVHIDTVRGYSEPAEAFVRTWRRYRQAWETAMDPGFNAVGVATRTANDGFVILVVVFVEQIRVSKDRDLLERQVTETVNARRRESGLRALHRDARLAAIARRHSEEMARLGYFDHGAPDGQRLEDRLRAAAVGFSRCAENLQMNRLASDPVGVAVDSWMADEAQRAAILTSDYGLTGVGLAVSEDGTFYFTQIFLTP